MNHCDPLNYWGAGDKGEFSSGKKKELKCWFIWYDEGGEIVCRSELSKIQKKVC